MTEKEIQERNVRLRKILIGEINEKLTGKPSKDKPHLKDYPEIALIEEKPKMTMYEYLYECNKNHLEELAIIFDTGFSETKITYKELFKNIDIIAEKLQSSGIKENDKVAVSLPNIPETPYIIYALNKIGAISCLIDPRAKEYALEKDLKELNVKMYIGCSETYQKIKKVSKKININRILIIPTLNSSDNKSVKLIYSLSKFKEKNIVFDSEEKWSKFISNTNTLTDLKKAKYKENNLAIISYTGGTTGVHKGVKISNDSINTVVFSHKYLIPDIHRGDKGMNTIPPFLIYGLVIMHLALCWGLPTYMILDSSLDKFVDYLVKVNPAIICGGPIQWETLINNSKLNNNSLSNMKVPICGGEKLTIAQENKISEALLKAGSKAPICNGFGASELGGSVTLNYNKDWTSGTVGKLHIFDNAKMVDFNTNEELTYNKEGKLLITTPSLMLGYYNNPEEEKKVISVDEDGIRWFDTGDIAKISENGIIEITGRSKRLFVCGINNVYPPEMEEIIYQIPNIKKCAVVNVPHKELREVPKVHIVLYSDNNEKRKQAKNSIIKSISEKINDEVIPHYFEFHKDLQYTANGKIDFKGIRENDLNKKYNNKL